MIIEQADNLNQIDANSHRLLSPRIQKSAELNLVKIKRPHRLSSTNLHFCKNKSQDIMHEKFKKIIKQRYPTIQITLGTIDFSGKGSIKEDDLVKYYQKFHFDFSEDEIKDYINRYKLLGQDGLIDKAMMAKVYYGHHFRNNFETPGISTVGMTVNTNSDLNPQSMNEINNAVSSRLKRIETVIKTKISSNWHQARKAFLDIDTDYDGFITANNFEELCGGAFELDEIKMLMKCKGVGSDYKIDFQKFCSWFGSALTPCEGFFFRHDSLVNPEYSLTLKKSIIANTAASNSATKHYDVNLLVRKITEKIAQQWKSIKTAFTKINCEKSKFIEKFELELNLRNWGFFLDQKTLDEVYNVFDYDKDGLINYQDFKRTIGYKIQPEEFLYFRQDNKDTIILKPHEQRNCWKELPNAQYGDSPFQYNIGLNKAMMVAKKLRQDVGEVTWNEIISTLRSVLTQYKFIQWTEFEDILKSHNREMLKRESDILRPIVGEFTQNGNILNLKKIEFLADAKTEQNNNLMVEEEIDDCKDFCTVYGYLSKTREEKIVEELNEEQLIGILSDYSHKDCENHFPNSLIKSIKSIDIDKNGYVTTIELSN